MSENAAPSDPGGTDGAAVFARWPACPMLVGGAVSLSLRAGLIRPGRGGTINGTARQIVGRSVALFETEQDRPENVPQAIDRDVAEELVCEVEWEDGRQPSQELNELMSLHYAKVTQQRFKRFAPHDAAQRRPGNERWVQTPHTDPCVPANDHQGEDRHGMRYAFAGNAPRRCRWAMPREPDRRTENLGPANNANGSTLHQWTHAALRCGHCG